MSPDGRAGACLPLLSGCSAGGSGWEGTESRDYGRRPRKEMHGLRTTFPGRQQPRQILRPVLKKGGAGVCD